VNIRKPGQSQHNFYGPGRGFGGGRGGGRGGRGGRDRGLNKELTKHIFATLVEKHSNSTFGGALVAYDGSASMYSSRPLPFEKKSLIVEVEGTSSGLRRGEFEVAIKHVSQKSTRDLPAFFTGRSTMPPRDCLTALDVVMRHTPASTLQMVGRSFYGSSDPVPMSWGLEAWFGFHQSLKPAQHGINMTVDVNATSFLKAIKLDKISAEFLGRSFDKNDSRVLNRKEWTALSKLFTNIKVEVKTDEGEDIVKGVWKIVGTIFDY